ncbi:MAG: type II toxin-antitoxin system RelE/ParE family toxin [Terriglobia bacterium]
MALADRARNEPRDLYDLWRLTSNEGVELGTLLDAIRQKLEFRGRPFKGIAAGVRCFPAGKYLIYYRHTRRVTDILHIFHGAQSGSPKGNNIISRR